MDFRAIKISDVAVRDVVSELRAGRYVSGPYVEKVEWMMQMITGKKYAVAVDSGTTALKIALRVNGMCKGDKIAVPDLTFIACVTAIMEIGAVPVPVEVDDRGIIDWSKLTEPVDGIMPVLLGGQNVKVPADETRPIVLDCAHYLGKVSKNFDACFSFHPSKIISSLGGGCYVTDDPEKAGLAKRLRMFGFEEGTRVTDGMIGYKGYMGNVSAAVALHELIDWPEKRHARESVRSRLNKALRRNYSGLGMYLAEVRDPDDVELRQAGFIRHWPKTISEMVFGVVRHDNAKRLTTHMVSAPFHEYMTYNEVNAVASILTKHISDKI